MRLDRKGGEWPGLGDRRLSRRGLLGAAAAGAAGLTLGAWGDPAGASGAGGTSGTSGVLTAAGARLRQPGSLPNPKAAAGTDQLPEVDHIVVVMMENHSFDNLLGMAGRGDGFPLGADGRPKAALPNGQGQLVHAFHMPSDCMTDGVGNDWNVAHRSYDDGTNQGFVEATTGEVMGYFLGSDLPFTWGLAKTFPLADRWFCSLLGQTDPNRRYHISGTSLGLVSDNFPLTLPPNGTIFTSFNKYGITWKDYYADLPTIGVYLPLLGKPTIQRGVVKMEQFYEDAAAGNLPQFSLLEPNYTVQSEENPQDIQYGDQYLASVVNAVLQSPQWSKTLMIWTYDEWGGWYDHVPPPVAIPPDDVPPDLPPGSEPGNFARYGFRVPAGVISPYAKRDYVSHTVYDHTSVLKTVETKWNLPALTYRDANAASVLDMVDFHATPAFLRPPVLPDPANPVGSYQCLTTGPGQIPPPSAVTARPCAAGAVSAQLSLTTVGGSPTAPAGALLFTDRSGATCSLSGVPVVSVVSAAGTAIAVYEVRSVPHRPAPVVLAPSGHAARGTATTAGVSITWSEWQCPQDSFALTVRFPGWTAPLTVPWGTTAGYAGTACTSTGQSLYVGPVSVAGQ